MIQIGRSLLTTYTKNRGTEGALIAHTASSRTSHLVKFRIIKLLPAKRFDN